MGAESHGVRVVSGGSLENHYVPWLIHKSKTEEPKTEMQQHRTGPTVGLTGEVHRSDQCATTVRNLRSGGHASRLQGLRRG
jgi:hypothetical protein